MLFCIAALGSTWGAYAAWFERLVGGSDRAEMMGAGWLYNHAGALYDANTARIRRRSYATVCREHFSI